MATGEFLTCPGKTVAECSADYSVAALQTNCVTDPQKHARYAGDSPHRPATKRKRGADSDALDRIATNMEDFSRMIGERTDKLISILDKIVSKVE